MKTYLGIDVGSQYIKAVEAGFSGKNKEIVKAIMFPATPKAFFSESKADHEELARTIKTGLHDAGVTLRQANVSLPESHVFTRIIDMPLLSDKELIQALRWEAERYVPLPLEEVNMDFVVLYKDAHKKTMEVLLVASPLSLIEKYTKIFEMAGVTLSALENEAIPLLRLFSSPTANRVMLDVGDDSTTIYLVRREILALVRTVGIGGTTLSKALMTELNLPSIQAEEYKRTYGIVPTQMDGRIHQILSPLLDNLVTEINQSLTYFKEKYPEEVITQIILSGGTILMPGFGAYLQEKVQLETVVANPWQGATISKDAERYQTSAPLFSVATGLAFRDFEK